MIVLGFSCLFATFCGSLLMESWFRIRRARKSRTPNRRAAQVRRLATVSSVFLTAVLGIPLVANAQQGYEFGIRFQTLQFRPQTFSGFSFQQPSFRTQVATPIQFSGIQFPAFNSRFVRRESAPGLASRATNTSIARRSSRENSSARKAAVSFERRRGISRREITIRPSIRLANRLGRRDPFAVVEFAATRQNSRNVHTMQIVHSNRSVGRTEISQSRQPFSVVGYSINRRSQPPGRSAFSRLPRYRREHLARGRAEPVQPAARDRRATSDRIAGRFPFGPGAVSTRR